MSDNEAIRQFESTLDAVDAGLERLRSGSYRTCTVCGGNIAATLLANDPLRDQCEKHLAVR